jgi:protein-S-isoprenylcysteine O-methyltransferase Ste14
MKRHIPPPIFALIAAVLMWSLCRWWPIAHWIGRPWNRLGALPAVIGLAIAVDAVRRFRHVRTTVNPVDPSKATQLVTDGVFRISRNPMYLGLVLLLKKISFRFDPSSALRAARSGCWARAKRGGYVALVGRERSVGDLAACKPPFVACGRL